MRQGRLCTALFGGIQCSTLVLDVPTHLSRIHGLNSTNKEYLQTVTFEG